MIRSIQKKIVIFIEFLYFKIFKNKMSDVMKNFLLNLSFMSVGMSLSAFLIFGVFLIAARIFGTAEYGKFQIIYTISQILIIPMLFGLNTSAVKYLATKSIKNEKNIIKSNLILLFILSTAMSITLIFLSKNIISSIFGVDIDLINKTLIFALFSATFFFIKSIIQGLKMMRFLAKIEFLFSIVISIVFLILVLFGFSDFKVIYFSFLSGYGVFILFAIFKSIKISDLYFFKKINWKVSKKIISYAKYAMLGSVSGTLLGNIDKIVIKEFSDFANVGIYSIYLIASTMIFAQLANIFNTVFFVHASASTNKKTIAFKLNKIIWILFVVSVLLACMILYVVLLIAGDEYPINIVYLLSFAINSGLIVISQIKMWFLNTEGLRGVKKTVQGTLFVGMLNFVLNLLFIPTYGIYGAILPTIFSNVVLYIFFTNQINRFFIDK